MATLTQVNMPLFTSQITRLSKTGKFVRVLKLVSLILRNMYSCNFALADFILLYAFPPDVRPSYIQNGFYGTVHVAGSQSELRGQLLILTHYPCTLALCAAQQWEILYIDYIPSFSSPRYTASTMLGHDCSTTATSTNHSPPPSFYWPSCSSAYPTSPLPPSPANSASSPCSRCSTSPTPAVDAGTCESYTPACPRPQDYASGVVLMGSYQVCMNYLPPYAEWPAMNHTPAKAFPMYSSSTSCEQAESPPPVTEDSLRDCQSCPSTDIFTQANGIQFYKDTKCGLEVMPPLLRQASDDSPQARIKSELTDIFCFW